MNTPLKMALVAAVTGAVAVGAFVAKPKQAKVQVVEVKVKPVKKPELPFLCSDGTRAKSMKECP